MVTLVPGLPLPGYNGLQFGLPAAGRLSRYWKQHRPDVVYVATEGPLGWSAMRVARRLGIRIFSGFHTSFHSYLKHYHVGWLHFPLLRYLCWFHNRTVGTVVPSVELRDRLQAIGLKNVSVVGRGVDAQVFNPNQRCPALRHTWGASSKDLVALYVGRVAPEKNLDLAIKAYRAMQRVDSSVKFAVVGDGPVRAALQKKHPDIIFCGVQTDEQLAKRYASADIFLFPSETETFGNVTLEAMASGLAVVAYDYAAAHLHIVDRHTGMLAPYGNAQAFVDAAVQLVQRRKSLIKIRHLARAHITTVDWQRIVETFAALLMNPLQQSDAGAEEDHSDSFAADEFATELH
jgi:glycosyltransferase involved in cell wall biosynthesis